MTTPSVVNPVSASGVTAPSITSATYNTISHVLTVTGSRLVALAGSNNDVTLSKLDLTGSGGKTVTLSTTDVDVTDATSFSVTLNNTDAASLATILDQDGTTAADTTVYNIAALSGWNTSLGSADATNSLSVSTPRQPFQR